MQRIVIICVVLLLSASAQSQILKKIGRQVKSDTEWKIERAARNKANQAIDSIANLPKKGKTKKEEKKQSQQTEATTKKESGETADPNDSEGYITLKLSTPVTSKGLYVTFSGESIKHDKWKTVSVVIKGPGDKETMTANLNDSGKYFIKYAVLEDGDYTITATSSDGKATASEKLLVTDWTQPDDETEELEKETKEAFNDIKEKAEQVKGMLGGKNKADLDAKVELVKKRLDALHKLLHSLRDARKEVAALDKAGKIPSANIREHLSQLNETLATKTAEVKQIRAMANHQPADNTICEYIVMVNEACAAFSTFTNVASKSIATIVKNVVLDKGVPKTVEVMNKGRAGSETEWGAKEASKIYATSLVDAEGLASAMGHLGFAGDLVQFATDVLLKTFCGIYKGSMAHTYKIIYRNEKGTEWWSYSVKSEAALTLRYPNSQSSGVIHMKGNIEGNATKFTFFADPDKNPGYAQGTAGKITTQVLKNYTPLSVPMSTALADQLGFGMLARGIATPAYFNIPIDAEYNTETGKIKIFINKAIADFSDYVMNRQFFIQWVAGLPKLRLSAYPISKARSTINASFREENEFEVTRDHKGNLSFGADVSRKIGSASEPHEHFLDTKMSAKKE
jgi:hypothetical protein